MEMLFACIKRCFIDLRFITVLMITWLACVCAMLVQIGALQNTTFVAFGPRPDLKFFHIEIDTQYKYGVLITLIILHTMITDFIADSLAPHVLNVLQDPKTPALPHKPIMYYFVTSAWALYCSISQLIVIFLAFAQLDLLLVRLASDLLANALTTSLYLQGKKYSPHAYTELPTAGQTQAAA